MKILRFVVFFALTVAIGSAALGGSLALLGPAVREFEEVTSYGPIDPAAYAPAQTSFMYDRNGNLVTPLFAEEDRIPIDLDQVPQHLIDAVIAIEDRKFYEHQGVDWNGVARALFENLDAGEVRQGGSTITQQLVKVTMSDAKDRDLGTKAQEAILAIRLEDELEKDEILERYLNVIYLGNGAYGVQSAAYRYWAKTPNDLTLGEAALLAALIQAPEDLNPVTHPDRAARRRALVLDAMVDTKKITQDEADLANLEPLPTQARNPDSRRDFFTTAVIDELMTDDENFAGDPAEFLGPDETARYNAVFRGGLKIYTTRDPLFEFVAFSSVEQILPDTPVIAAVVILDNADLGVRAMYPGRDFAVSQFNPITTNGRQTGSSFKAITLATALDAGYSPLDRVSGSTLTFPDRPQDEPLDCSGGTMTLTDAVAKSNNCAFTRTVLSLGPGNRGNDGPERVKEMAGRLGIDTEQLDPVPYLTLGTSDTNMMDMAEAFATFANDGIHRRPMFVTRIEGPDGTVIFEADQTGDRVLRSETARTETSMLTEVVKRGTGTRADIGRPVAGKTGTTTKNTDAWFVGYTPQFTAAVWMGFPDGSKSMNDFGITAQGGRQPAQIWAAVMEPLHRDLPILEFTAPDEAQWGTAQRINEHGRIFSRDFVGADDDTTTTLVPPDVTTVVPPPDVTTVPGPPPATTPPATTPPVTPPPQNLPPPNQP